MIKLTFFAPGQTKDVMNFIVENRNIYYSDRVFHKRLRIVPRDEAFIQKVRNSRNEWSPKLIEMFTLSAKQQAEYDAAKTDEELANIIKKDCLGKGCTFYKEEFV